MKSSYLIAALITLVTVAWVASGVIRPDGSLRAQEPDLRPPQAVHHEAPAPRVRVRVLHAQEREDTLVVLGETRASRTVEVRAETGGRVEDVPVPEGAVVTAGTVLARLAMDDRQARLGEAQAAVARWEDRVSGDERLVRGSYTSRQTLMESRASLEAARAAMAAIQLDIARVEMTAPFDGVLETRLVEVGNFVSVGDPVAKVVDLDPMTVVAHIAEADIGRVAQGQPGTARLVNGRTVAGQVSYVARVADGVTRTFAVELEIPNADGAIPEGMTAELRLPLSRSRAHSISPAVLSLDDEGRIGVKIVDDDNRVVFHPVTMAGDDAGLLWVEGLPDPVQLIIVGQEFVSPGQQVEPVAEDTIAANTEALAKADTAALAAGRATDATVADVTSEDGADDGGDTAGVRP